MFKNKVLAVTGGSGGIGRAIAERFGRAGAKVALLDLDEGLAKKNALDLEQSGIVAMGVACDVTEPEACVRAVAEVAERFGSLDVLVNSAGLTQIGLFSETDLAVYRRVMDVNFFGSVYCTKAALPWLKKGRGQIVAISSVAGFAPLLGRTGYCASKHALHGFFDTLRCEVLDDGVGITIACPSFVDTEFAKSGLGPDGRPLITERSTTGELMTPTDVAEAIYRGVSKRQRLIVISRTGKIAFWTSRLLPWFYARTMTRRFNAAIDLSLPKTHHRRKT